MVTEYITRPLQSFPQLISRYKVMETEMNVLVKSINFHHIFFFFYSFVEIKKHLEKGIDDFEQFNIFKMQLSEFQFSDDGKTRKLQNSLKNIKKYCTKV